MSKWINKDLFNNFKKTKENEQDSGQSFTKRMDIVWKTPEKGTIDKAKIYELRFLPDKNGIFYQKYFYHMFKVGEKWFFDLCTKSFPVGSPNLSNFCPFCTLSNKLYKGTQADKAIAKNYFKKERFVGNIFVVKDLRDVEIENEEDKSTGKVKLYEFPGKVEMKLKAEIIDERNGLGASIFDPGEDGYNFILKIHSTKPDKEGKTWPDYANSIFGRKPGPIAETEEEISKIMENTFDIKEYISNLKKSDDDVISVLKNEMNWELVADDWNKEKGIKQERVEVSSTENNDTNEEDEEDDIDDSFGDSDDSNDQTDEELLKELDEM